MYTPLWCQRTTKRKNLMTHFFDTGTLWPLVTKWARFSSTPLEIQHVYIEVTWPGHMTLAWNGRILAWVVRGYSPCASWKVWTLQVINRVHSCENSSDCHFLGSEKAAWQLGCGVTTSELIPGLKLWLIAIRIVVWDPPGNSASSSTHGF